MTNHQPLSLEVVLWSLAATALFLALNAFFVAAEFALVRVRGARIRALAADGDARAGVAARILERLDLHLSACQLGITAASLVLGWLAEPAVAGLLIFGAEKLGWSIGDARWVRGAALVVALTIVTFLHVTIGEQAPKVWALRRAEPMALRVSRPLRWFTVMFSPAIRLVDWASSAILRLAGVGDVASHEPPARADELREMLAASAEAGHISKRQRQFADNVIKLADLEVRHVFVPRSKVIWLEVDAPWEESLRCLGESTHARLPLCRGGLDATLGVVHAKDVVSWLARGETPDLATLAHHPVFVPDTQPLGRMIVELQRAGALCAFVLDDHGTVLGMAFLEDALEEIVGPMRDDLGHEGPAFEWTGPDSLVMRGDLPLPDAEDLLGIEIEEGDDTVGGHVVAELGRLPAEGDSVRIGRWTASVLSVDDRRVGRLGFERTTETKDAE